MYSNTLIFGDEKNLNNKTKKDHSKITPYNSLFLKDSPRMSFPHAKIYGYTALGVIAIYMILKTLDTMLDTA